MTDEQEHASGEEHGQGVAGQRPANDEIYEHPRPTVLIHIAMMHVSEVVSPEVRVASVDNVDGSEHNVGSQNSVINVTILGVEGIPLVGKIANEIRCPGPVL